jgi:hypothetical protein
VKELKAHAYRIVTLRTPDHPVVSEKILRWIENANIFEQKLDETIISLRDEY